MACALCGFEIPGYISATSNCCLSQSTMGQKNRYLERTLVMFRGLPVQPPWKTNAKPALSFYVLEDA